MTETSTQKFLKYSKIKIHLHRSILNYLEFDSLEAYYYLRFMLLWNRSGFNALPNAGDDELTLMQHLVFLDTLYYHGQVTLGSFGTENFIQSWFRIYSPESLPISNSRISFSYLYLPGHDNLLHKAYHFFRNCNKLKYEVTEVPVTYDYKRQSLRFINSLHRNMRCFPMPFGIIFKFGDDRPIQIKRIFDMKLLQSFDFYKSTQDFYFLVKLDQRDTLFNFKFNLATDYLDCYEIELTSKIVSFDHTEQYVLTLTYEKSFSNKSGLHAYVLDRGNGSIFSPTTDPETGCFTTIDLENSKHSKLFKKFFHEQKNLFDHSKMYIQFF